MHEEKVTIEGFSKLLGSDREGSALLEVLRKLTEANREQVAAGMPGPSPLGSWSGWGY